MSGLAEHADLRIRRRRRIASERASASKKCIPSRGCCSTSASNRSRESTNSSAGVSATASAERRPRSRNAISPKASARPKAAKVELEAVATPVAKHTFALGRTDFLLDGAPFQVIGCELHPARIPAEYWTHRIRMAKAHGLQRIAAYVFWNHHETAEGMFDFATGNRDLARFLRLVQAEGLWVILRPGPYVCAEWDFGGIPP